MGRASDLNYRDHPTDHCRGGVALRFHCPHLLRRMPRTQVHSVRDPSHMSVMTSAGPPRRRNRRNDGSAWTRARTAPADRPEAKLPEGQVREEKVPEGGARRCDGQKRRRHRRSPGYRHRPPPSIAAPPRSPEGRVTKVLHLSLLVMPVMLERLSVKRKYLKQPPRQLQPPRRPWCHQTWYLLCRARRQQQCPGLSPAL